MRLQDAHSRVDTGLVSPGCLVVRIEFISPHLAARAVPAVLAPQGLPFLSSGRQAGALELGGVTRGPLCHLCPATGPLILGIPELPVKGRARTVISSPPGVGGGAGFPNHIQEECLKQKCGCPVLKGRSRGKVWYLLRISAFSLPFLLWGWLRLGQQWGSEHALCPG